MDGSGFRISYSGMAGPLSGDDLLHLRVLVADHFPIDRDWNARDVRSPYWRIYRNLHDGAEVLLPDGGRHRITARHLHLIPAWVTFTCRCTARVDHLYTHVDLLGVPGAVVREVFPRPFALPLDAALAGACDRLAERLADPAQPDAARLCATKAMAYEAFARAFAGLPQGQAERCVALRRAGHAVAPALALIDFRPDETQSNAVLARACGLSEDHFIRRFRALVGQTPAQYVLERRIAAAAQRLLAGEEPIDDIAAACGFPDRFYFTRMFSRKMGLPPAAYRSRGRV